MKEMTGPRKNRDELQVGEDNRKTENVRVRKDVKLPVRNDNKIEKVRTDNKTSKEVGIRVENENEIIDKTIEKVNRIKKRPG